MIKYCQRAILYLLSFLVPMIVLMLGLIALHITPFGNHTLVISDSRAIFLSDLSFFTRLIQGKEDLLYSFKSGIGLNTSATVSTIFDPVNFIAFGFDISNFTTMFSCAITVSIALSGLSMFHFLSVAYGYGDVRHLVFSTAYALIGFNVAYCFLFTFLLPVMLLPLIALGVRKIVLGESPWLFLGTLSCMILSSYYMGYMLCIASIVLFFMWYVKEKDNMPAARRAIRARFIVSVICSGLITTVTWLPSLLSIAGGRLEQTSFLDLTFNENMGISDIGAKLFAGANTTDELVNGLPNIFCTTFVLFLSLAYFFDCRNSLRAKIAYGSALGFYFLTFYIKALSMAMQGFSVTNWFNYRYSYVFSFIMIVMAREEFAEIRQISLRDLKRAGIALTVFVVAVFSKQYAFTTGGNMLLGIVILCLILAAVQWNRRDEKRAPKGQVAVIALLLSSIELYANFCICVYNVQDWSADAEAYQKDLFYGSVIAESVQSSDVGFYRMVNEHQLYENCDNDPRCLGYNGTSYYGSNARTSMYRGLCKLGQAWYTNRTWYGEGEPAAFDALLGIKYVAARRNLSAEKGYKKLLEIGAESLYSNANALPVGLLTSSNEVLPDMGKCPFENHNEIWRGLSGESDDVFTEESELSFEYHSGFSGVMTDKSQAENFSLSASLANSDGVEMDANEKTSPADVSSEMTRDASNSNEEHRSPFWIECTFVAKQDGPIYSYNAGLLDESSGYVLEAMEYLGTYAVGDMVAARINLPLDVDEQSFYNVCAEYHVAYANDDVLSRYCKKLQEESGSLEKIRDSYLVGSLDASHDGRLFFTIPYDEGWALTVDGTETPLESDAGFFMSAPIAAGAHNYELKFFPCGMKTGIAVSCVGLMLTAVFAIVDMRWRKRDKLVEVALAEGGHAATTERDLLGAALSSGNDIANYVAEEEPASKE